MKFILGILLILQEIDLRNIKIVMYNRQEKILISYFISIFDLFDKFGINNCKIILIKEYDVCDRKHLEMYECLWICKLKQNCLNKTHPFRIKFLSDKLYNKECNKIYYKDNKEKEKERIKQYRENNP